MELYDSLEEKVENIKNETNIEKIGIYGLFGRYNIEIPFEKSVNIFIGENGLGKTTILNCIYFLLEKKFDRLSNIKFSYISIKFKTQKNIKISFADVVAYNEKNRRRSIVEIDIQRTIERFVLFNDHIDFDNNKYVEELVYELYRKFDMPISAARNYIMKYFNQRGTKKISSKGEKHHVEELEKMISSNIKQKIIYLPTYRRIEDDFPIFNRRQKATENAELLIRFGMSDVQNSVARVLDNIRSLAVSDFSKMTAILLKEYVNKDNPVNDFYNPVLDNTNLNIETVRIVLDRIGMGIDSEYKEEILKLVTSGKIYEYDYRNLLNLITKLIDNYNSQRIFDDRIKKFSDTCNKYLNDKHFHYNPSTLELDVLLDDDLKSKQRSIELMQLSSGEKQIVSLFSRLYLEEEKNTIIIIDEPELSLSLRWQRMLLPDIMRSNKCDLLLAVTHSPFIFENEFDFDAKSIRDCII